MENAHLLGGNKEFRLIPHHPNCYRINNNHEKVNTSLDVNSIGLLPMNSYEMDSLLDIQDFKLLIIKKTDD